jgi:hypothetical protein
VFPKCVPSDACCCELDPKVIEALDGFKMLTEGALIPDGWFKATLEAIGGFPNSTGAPTMPGSDCTWDLTSHSEGPAALGALG